MDNKIECTWCEKEFSYTDEDVGFYEDIRWIDENNCGFYFGHLNLRAFHALLVMPTSLKIIVDVP